MQLETISHWASILTAAAVLAAWLFYICSRSDRRRKLEKYLRVVKAHANELDEGRRTIMYVSGKLKMTEAQVLEAAFSSNDIHCGLGMDKETGRANCLFLEHGYNAVTGSSDGL